MSPARIAFAAALVFVTAGAAQAESLQRGELLVRRHCGGCHAVGRSGDSREPAAPRFRELYRRYDPELLAEALAQGMLTGHPAMPEFRFEPKDVAAITSYLRAIQARQGV